MYLTVSCPNLCYSVGVCSQYQTSPKDDSHLLAVEKIIKYVSGTIDYCLWYTRDTTTSLVGYYDADWVGNSEDQKNTYGGFFS